MPHECPKSDALRAAAVAVGAYLEECRRHAWDLDVPSGDLFMRLHAAVIALDVARPNPYWGCTCLSGCDYGFGGTEEDLPREWEFCPCCGGPLTEITVG